jgi:hypothetical protein
LERGLIVLLMLAILALAIVYSGGRHDEFVAAHWNSERSQ